MVGVPHRLLVPSLPAPDAGMRAGEGVHREGEGVVRRHRLGFGPLAHKGRGGYDPVTPLSV